MINKIKSQVREIKASMLGGKGKKEDVKTFSLTKEESDSTKFAERLLLKKQLEAEEIGNLADALSFKYNAWVSQLVSKRGIQPTPDQLVEFNHDKKTMKVTITPKPEVIQPIEKIGTPQGV